MPARELKTPQTYRGSRGWGVDFTETFHFPVNSLLNPIFIKSFQFIGTEFAQQPGIPNFTPE